MVRSNEGLVLEAWLSSESEKVVEGGKRGAPTKDSRGSCPCDYGRNGPFLRPVFRVGSCTLWHSIRWEKEFRRSLTGDKVEGMRWSTQGTFLRIAGTMVDEGHI